MCRSPLGLGAVFLGEVVVTVWGSVTFRWAAGSQCDPSSIPGCCSGCFSNPACVPLPVANLIRALLPGRERDVLPVERALGPPGLGEGGRRGLGPREPLSQLKVGVLPMRWSSAVSSWKSVFTEGCGFATKSSRACSVLITQPPLLDGVSSQPVS